MQATVGGRTVAHLPEMTRYILFVEGNGTSKLELAPVRIHIMEGVTTQQNEMDTVVSPSDGGQC